MPSHKKDDRLSGLLKGVRRMDLDKALRKDHMVTMRVSESDHRGMKDTAKDLGLTVTEYVLRLHQFVSDRMQKDGGE